MLTLLTVEGKWVRVRSELGAQGLSVSQVSSSYGYGIIVSPLILITHTSLSICGLPVRQSAYEVILNLCFSTMDNGETRTSASCA